MECWCYLLPYACWQGMYHSVCFVVTDTPTDYCAQLPWDPLLSKYNGDVGEVVMNESITVDDWERAIAQLDPLAESFFLSVSPLHVCCYFTTC